MVPRSRPSNVPPQRRVTKSLIRNALFRRHSVQMRSPLIVRSTIGLGWSPNLLLRVHPRPVRAYTCIVQGAPDP